MTISTQLLSTLAPRGHIRASINTGNPILARLDGDGRPAGVSVDLARRFARQLGLELELVVFDTAGKSVDAVTREEADFGFFAVDPVRGAGIAFSAPYVLIEGSYLVRQDSPLTGNAQVDQAGHTVVVGKQAQILRAPSSPAVVETFVQSTADVAAGVRQQLETDARRIPGLRLLPGRFMVIQQAMGIPKPRGAEAQRVLAAFVEDAKASGFVAEALARHGIEGATVAPRADA